MPPQHRPIRPINADDLATTIANILKDRPVNIDGLAAYRDRLRGMTLVQLKAERARLTDAASGTGNMSGGRKPPGSPVHRCSGRLPD